MMGIFNFAHGEFVLLGAYFTYILHNHGLPVAVAMAQRCSYGNRVFVAEAREVVNDKSCRLTW
jgi:branched-chain amino acid transport system permease protein